MGHVFISYSRVDRAYVERLAAHLKESGVDVWYDHEIVTGRRWSLVIEQKIETCDAMIVVMSPAARASDMVENEINLAQSRNKEILPLLLSGEAFFLLKHLQYTDVRAGQLPGPDFIRLVPHSAKGGQDSIAPHPPPAAVAGGSQPEPKSQSLTATSSQISFPSRDTDPTILLPSRIKPPTRTRRPPEWLVDESKVRPEPLITSAPQRGPIRGRVLIAVFCIVLAVGVTLVVQSGGDGTAVGQRPMQHWVKYDSWSLGAVAFNGDGRVVGTASADGQVRFWDTASGGELKPKLIFSQPLLALAFSSNGRFLATAGYGNKVTMGDGKTRTTAESPILAFEARDQPKVGPPDAVIRLAFSPNSTVLAIVCSDRNTTNNVIAEVQLWDVATKSRRNVTIGGILNPRLGAIFSPDGKKLAVGTSDALVRIVDPSTGIQVGDTLGKGQTVYTAAFSPDGRTIAIGGTSNAVQLYDLVSRKPVGSTMKERDIVTDVAFGLDGKVVVTASGAYVTLRSASTGQTLGEPMYLGYSIDDLAVSQSGKLLAVLTKASLDVWDLEKLIVQSGFTIPATRTPER